jgi:hypothetical protein
MKNNRMRAIGLALVIVAAGQSARAEPQIAELQALHTKEAESYSIYRDEKKSQKLELAAKPVFNWTNLVGAHTQFGHLFLWTWKGRPEVIGTIFSTHREGRRAVIHEFHTLSTERLFPVTPETSQYQWTPERGIVMAPCEDAPAVAESGAQRLLQMRGLARSFSAESHKRDGQTWEMRLLPTPLAVYQPTSGDVREGALFAMVSSEGTDPEVLLIIEARHPRGDDTVWKWHAAALRFSDKDLTVRRNDKTLWSSRDDADHRAEINRDYTLIQTRDKTYMCYRARIVDELPDAVP